MPATQSSQPVRHLWRSRDSRRHAGDLLGPGRGIPRPAAQPDQDSRGQRGIWRGLFRGLDPARADAGSEDAHGEDRDGGIRPPSALPGAAGRTRPRLARIQRRQGPPDHLRHADRELGRPGGVPGAGRPRRGAPVPPVRAVALRTLPQSLAGHAERGIRPCRLRHGQREGDAGDAGRPRRRRGRGAEMAQGRPGLLRLRPLAHQRPLSLLGLQDRNQRGDAGRLLQTDPGFRLARLGHRTGERPGSLHGRFAPEAPQTVSAAAG